MNDHNFPNLWASFRAQVQAARGETEQPSIYTAGEDSLTQRDGAIVDIWEPCLHETPATSTVSIRGTASALRFQVHQADLLAIAAQCMAVAEQMGELPIAEGFNAGAHGHLLTERAPVDDEHNN